MRPTGNLRVGVAALSPLPFLPLIEEKEAKEDEGDDRHQVCWEDSMLQNFSPPDTAKAPWIVSDLGAFC